MMTQETYLTAFVEGVRATTERFIQVSQFDKTIEATITAKDEKDNHLFYVSSYGGANFSVPTLANDTGLYLVGEQVYINLPNGDYNSANRYIIGKVKTTTLKGTIFKKEKNMIEDYQTTNSLFYNRNCDQILIIEFDAYIEINNSNAKGIKETLVNFNLFKPKNKQIIQQNYWSTKNLYGNIFDKDIVNKYRIIIRNLESLFNFGIEWNHEIINNSLSVPVEIIDLQGNVLTDFDERSLLRINNIIYYVGYDINKISNNSIQNTSILLTYNGFKLFHLKDDKWSIVTLEELKELEPNYEWSIFWYNWNPLQEDYNSINTPVPQYWDGPLEDGELPEFNNYKNKLVLLQSDNGYTKNTIYSTLR